MKFSNCLILLALCLASSAIGQNRDDNREIMNQFLKGTAEAIDRNPEIKGSPFLDEDFATGMLYFENNDPLPAEIRYDVVKEEIQVKFDEDSYRVVHDGILVQIENDLFKKYGYKAEDKTVGLLGYFRILTDDFKEKDLILLEKPYKKVKRGKEAAAMQKATPPKYLDKSAYYLKFAGSNSAVEVERRLKNFLKAFPEDRQDQLRSYIKENKLKPKREKDLKHIVNYYNNSFQA